MIRATLPKRQQDPWGDGEFGAPRGGRKHKGIDYCCYPGTIIRAQDSGTVTKHGYPYKDLAYRYVEITDISKNRHRYFYVEPTVELYAAVFEGDAIGISQDIASRYQDPGKGPMTNHVHYEILEPDGTPINPEEYHL